MNNKNISQYYDGFSAQLQQEANRGRNARHDMIFETFDKIITPGMTALDLGCGAGVTSRYLAQSGLTVTGVDLSPENIRFASENMAHVGLEYLCADASALSLGRTFDLIAACDVLEHIPPHRRGAFLRAISAHAHQHTIIYLNVPDGRFQGFMRRFHPESQQIIDEALDFDVILTEFYGYDFEILGMHSRGLDAPAQYTEYIFVKRGYLEEIYEGALAKFYPKGEPCGKY